MKHLIKKLKIGSVELKNNLALAPMAGITNAAFRSLCIEGGAGLVVSEMVSAESIRYGNRKTLKLLEIYPSEHPIAIQLFGSDPCIMALAAEEAEKLGADIIDVNAGCPVRKVCAQGSGAALMKEPGTLETIIKKIVKAVKLPVTVKIRSGLAAKEIISPGLAVLIEGAGASAITLHGRAAADLHGGPPDYEAFAGTAAAVKIPVFGNGGVRAAADAARILETGCAGVAIGRAAVENPAVFAEVAEGLKDGGGERKGGKTGEGGGTAHNVTRGPAEKIKLFMRFLELNAALYGPERGVICARKLVGYWLKGFPHSSALRASFMAARALPEANALLLQYMGKHDSRIV
ncbi:MAG: tRNA-dihydrouridine synthase [Elusimicrobia bacterium]|nr:tRNA-dihydrouridine synthase [Elusimicrobiota bacterium]